MVRVLHDKKDMVVDRFLAGQFDPMVPMSNLSLTPQRSKLLQSRWGLLPYFHGGVRMSKDKKPKNPVSDKGNYRILRGGGWNRAVGMRSTYRNGAPPDFSASLIGFRIVKNTPKDKQ